MNAKEFAGLLVEEVVETNPPDSRKFINENGIDASNLGNADEIWKAFVRYNIDAYGMKSGTVWKYWNKASGENLIKNRIELLNKIKDLKCLECYNNFTIHCPVTFKSGNFVNKELCYQKDSFSQCPVVILIQELKWHRAHYRVSKILVENAKRLLIENIDGAKNKNLNDVVNGIFVKHTNDNSSITATTELLSIFDNIKGYGSPPKVITWFFSELSSPVHQIEHWPKLDYKQLSPVDTHVLRLMVRFEFLKPNEATNKNIENKLSELYSEEPRKLDYGLYRLGAESEENICGKIPNCELCKVKHLKLYLNCPAKDKIVYPEVTCSGFQLTP